MKRLYDWETLFENPRFIIRRKRDYTCATHGMIQQIRDAARKRGLGVSILADDGAITVTVKKIKRRKKVANA